MNNFLTLLYSVVWNEAVNTKIGDYVVHSVPPPGSGSILVYILNILQHFNIQPGDDVPLLYHRILEAFKWAYAVRTDLGDPFDPEITENVNQVILHFSLGNCILWMSLSIAGSKYDLLGVGVGRLQQD